jgi:hypothetical protein
MRTGRLRFLALTRAMRGTEGQTGRDRAPGLHSIERSSSHILNEHQGHAARH